MKYDKCYVHNINEMENHYQHKLILSGLALVYFKTLQFYYLRESPTEVLSHHLYFLNTYDTAITLLKFKKKKKTTHIMIQTRFMFYSWDRFFPLHKKGNSLVQHWGHSLSSTTGCRKDAQVTMGIWGAMVEGGGNSSL